MCVDASISTVSGQYTSRRIASPVFHALKSRDFALQKVSIKRFNVQSPGQILNT